jgi:elongin-A
MAPRHIKTLLKGVVTATQLHSWELKSDDIYDETAEHWHRLIDRDFPTLAVKHDYKPKACTSWHKVYDLYKKLNDEEIAASTQKMIEEFAAKETERTSRLTKVISGETSAMLQKGRAKAGFGPSRAKQSFMQKAKQEVRREAARFYLPTPTGKLIVPPGQIKKAPHTKLREPRVARQDFVPLTVGPLAPAQTSGLAGREEKEDRLHQTKTSVLPTATFEGNIVSFSDDEPEAENVHRSKALVEDEDDLFGELQSDEDDVLGNVQSDEDDLMGEFEPKGRISPSSLKPLRLPEKPIHTFLVRRRPSNDTDAEPNPKRRRSPDSETVGRTYIGVPGPELRVGPASSAATAASSSAAVPAPERRLSPAASSTTAVASSSAGVSALKRPPKRRFSPDPPTAPVASSSARVPALKRPPKRLSAAPGSNGGVRVTKVNAASTGEDNNAVTSGSQPARVLPAAPRRVPICRPPVKLRRS